MNPTLNRLLASSAIVVCSSALSAAAACTRTTDRVIEPVGASDAGAKAPDVGDAALNPLTPIARPPEPAEDFRLVRGNEFGAILRDVHDDDPLAPGMGGASPSGGAAGSGGSNLRPVVASGGSPDRPD